MEYYVGQLVVLRSRWNIHSSRIGIVIEQEPVPSDAVLVLWTTKDGVKIKRHLIDAVLPIIDKTLEKIGERICDIR